MCKRQEVDKVIDKEQTRDKKQLLLSRTECPCLYLQVY